LNGNEARPIFQRAAIELEYAALKARLGATCEAETINSNLAGLVASMRARYAEASAWISGSFMANMADRLEVGAGFRRQPN
jgi:hypothetical protein